MTIEQQLEKARIWAYWSFIGLVVPVAGILAAAVSLSILNRLAIHQDDHDVLEEHANIMNLAEIGKLASVLVLIVTLVAGFIVGASVGDTLGKLQAEPQTQISPYVEQMTR